MQIRIRISRRTSPDAQKQPLETEEPANAPPVLDNQPAAKPPAQIGGSARVALGILGSRLTGLIRERVIGHYFGIETIVADAFRAAYRIPNLLNVLFGEGVLSASFITVYSKLRATRRDDEAEDLAEAVFGILSVVCSVLVLLGVLLTPFLIDLIAPGFQGEKRDLTIRIVRVLFPSTGVLVMGAWCLGVLNSHRRFLLSYLAPVALNITVIATLVLLGRGAPQDRLVIYAAWAWVAGSVLQFLVQFPKVLELLPDFHPTLQWRSANVRSVLGNFGPIFVSRGVVQISALIDQIISSYLPKGAVAALATGQVISTLPISLFSMSVAAAELPALSSAVGNQEEVAAFLRRRLSTGLRRIAFFIVPSAVAFLVLGDVLTAFLYETGHFRHSDAIYVWSVLAGSAVGLLAGSLGRLYSSAFYALLDTKTPLRFAVIRVALTTVLGWLCALRLPHWIGIDLKWGVAGLTASAGIAGWVEFVLLRRALNRRIGKTGLAVDFTLKLWSIAFLGAAAGYLVKLAVGGNHPILLALLVLPLYGAIYFGGTLLAGVEESSSTINSIRRRFVR